MTEAPRAAAAAAAAEVVWVENSKVGPTGSWWVKDLVSLKRKQTEGR